MSVIQGHWNPWDDKTKTRTYRVYGDQVVGGTFIESTFDTDGGSIPFWLRVLAWVMRIPSEILDPWGKFLEEWVAHDHDYTTTESGIDRAGADRKLRQALIAKGCPEIYANRVYSGIRRFGASHWKD